MVFLDVGGPIYGDRPYYEGLLAAIRERRPDASADEFWAEFEACRRDQKGPFTRRLTSMFLGEEDLEDVIARGRELWHYPPESLQPDVRESLPVLAERYRLGVLANQETWIRETMRRDGIEGYFDVWAVSAEVGAEKPDPAIFRYALQAAGIAPNQAVMVGDRLDNDIRAARDHGMRTVWVLRGEAPPEPTEEQLAVPDASVSSLAELADALAAMP